MDSISAWCLSEEALAPAFWRPLRLGVASAWYGHVPFAFWLTAHLKPDVIVELGTHNGVSYAAFCQAVERLGLSARCYAVDTWKGDLHSGYYSEDVFGDLSTFNQQFRRFSSLLRMTFDEAVETFADGSIGLLHIDGEHTYEAVRHDFETWRPKLAQDAVVLFHDTNVRDRGFGVWRFWNELRENHPGFEFLHASGLGAVAAGPETPAVISALHGIRPERTVTALRERFALLGERWEFETRYTMTLQDARQVTQDLQALQAAHTELESALKAARNQEIRASKAMRELDRELANTQILLTATRHERDHFRHEKEVMLNSTMWRLLEPIRAAADLFKSPPGRSGNGAIENGGQAQAGKRGRASQEAIAAPGTPTMPALLFISGEPETPGHSYRVRRAVEAAAGAGASARWMTVQQAAAAPAELRACSGLVIWRARHSASLAQVISTAKAAGASVVVDVDDLMFRPDLASRAVIDGIRSQGLTEQEVRQHFEDVLAVIAEADLCTCPTNELAQHIREFQIPALVLPNGFDAAQHSTARRAVRERATQSQDGLLRIGYAAGSRTHQRDFDAAAQPIAEFLRDHPEARLVVFQTPDRRTPVLDIEEFPVFDDLTQQIEWRPLVALEDLPAELARFDINVAPLEVGNPFCEAKSELKYFEAALVDVPTIASPTGPFLRAIHNNRTGLLAENAADWRAGLERLAAEAKERRAMGCRAYNDVLWRYGPARRSELMRLIMAQMRGGADAVRAFELEIRRSEAERCSPPVVQAEQVFLQDRMRDAAATVVIPLYNYSEYIADALQSVAAQTIADLDLVVVDDASTDRSLEITISWARENASRFNRLLVLRHPVNGGLAAARNSAINAAETEYVLPLDADNRLLPSIIEECLRAINGTGAGFAYPMIRCFGASSNVIGDVPFQPARLVGGNYIDAMALLAKWAWAAAGGYQHVQHGWEDYDFWCRCVEQGVFGIRVEQVLAEYRVHEKSMLRTATDLRENKRALLEELQRRHAWLSVTQPA